MKFNFHKIKELMQGDHYQPLPPELDWGNMKDGILDKMQAAEQADLADTPKKGPRKRLLLLLCLLIMFSFGALIGLFSLWQNGALFSSRETAEGAVRPEPSANESRSLTFAQADSCEDVEMAGNPGAISTQNPLQVTESIVSRQGQISLKSAGLKSPESSGSPIRQNHSHQDHLSGPDGMLAGEQGSGDEKEAQEGLREQTASPAAGVDGQMPDTMALLPVRPDFIGHSQEHKLSPESQEVDSAFLPSVQRPRPISQLILEGGINFWTEGFGKSSPERARYEVPISSFQLQGHYLRGLKRGYFVMAGLQYQRLESKLEYRTMIEDYPITLKDTIIQVRKNLLTNEETIIRGDAVQYVQAERRIRHFNKTELLKASLAIGKNWRFNSFLTDVYLGGALNGMVRNEGRMLFEGEIIDYDGASNPFFQNQWTVDGVMGARLHYFPYQRIGIVTGFQAQRSLMNWSRQSDVRFYPLSVSLQVGLSYSL